MTHDGFPLNQLQAMRDSSIADRHLGAESVHDAEVWILKRPVKIDQRDTLGQITVPATLLLAPDSSVFFSHTASTPDDDAASVG